MPDHIIDRMTKAAAGIPKEERKARQNAWRAEGIQVCIDLIDQVKEIEGVAGVHVMAIEWEEAVESIVEGANLLPRPVFD
jgi:methylenetetrahydrofolate reductase (NADPH)